jgi:hypothetical protein
MTSAPSDLTAPTPESIAGYVRRHAARAKKVLTGMHDHGMASLLSAPMKPADVLNMASTFAYDSLAI